MLIAGGRRYAEQCDGDSIRPVPQNLDELRRLRHFDNMLVVGLNAYRPKPKSRSKAPTKSITALADTDGELIAGLLTL
jgi:hypothetical protein